MFAFMASENEKDRVYRSHEAAKHYNYHKHQVELMQMIIAKLQSS